MRNVDGDSEIREAYLWGIRCPASKCLSFSFHLNFLMCKPMHCCLVSHNTANRKQRLAHRKKSGGKQFCAGALAWRQKQWFQCSSWYWDAAFACGILYSMALGFPGLGLPSCSQSRKKGRQQQLCVGI